MHEILIPNARRYYTSELNLIQQVFLLKNYVISAIIRLIHLSPKQTLSHIFLLTMNAIKEAHYNLGIAYLEAGQYSKAIPEFEASIKLDSNFIEAHCALCRAYLEQDELEKAGISVTAALKLDATHQPALLLRGTISEAYHDRGKAYLDDKRYTDAVAALQKAINLDTDLADNLQTSPLEKTHIHVHLGAAYIGMKAYQNAIEALQNAIALEPDLVDAHYHLGHAYVEQGHPDKAIPHLERATAIAPNLKRAHYNLARAHRELGNLEAATHAVTETLRLDSNYQPAHEIADTIKQAHYNRGITYLNDERYSEAITAFQNAIILDPNFTTAYYNLGLTYLKMETYSRATEVLQKTITLDRTYKAAHHALALAYFGQQELRKARDTARDTLKLDPNYQPARSLLETIDPSFTPLETKAATLPAPDQSATPQPDVKPRQETHYELGIVYQDAKMYTEAVAEFKKVIDLDSDFVAAHINLGKVYLEMEQPDEAENAAKAALRIDANSEPAHQILEDIKLVRPASSPDKSPKQTKTTLVPIDIKRDLERGYVFLNNRQYNQAAAAFKRVIKVDANSVEAHYGLGQAYLGIEAFDDAKTAANEVLKRNPNHQSARELIQLIKFARNIEKNRKIRKKALSYVAILGVFALGVFIQLKFDIFPWPKLDPEPPPPPKLSIEASLSKRYLYAGRTADLELTIKNSGGMARNVEIRFQPQSSAGLNYERRTTILEIPKNKEKTIKIPISADNNIIPRKEFLKIELSGNDGTIRVTKNLSFTIFGPDR